MFGSLEFTYISVRVSCQGHENPLLGSDPRPPFPENLGENLALIRRKDNFTRIYSSSLRVQPKNKLGHNTKVGTTTPDTPEKVRVFGRAGFEDAAVCCDDGDLFDVVDDETMRSAEPAVAASEGQTRWCSAE